LWAKSDKDQTKGPFEVSAKRAQVLNTDGYGVFWTPNEHLGPRKIENIIGLYFWYVELDGNDIPRQKRAIESSPLRPSHVVASRNGYHCYWAVQGAVSLEDWREGTRRLIAHYRADNKCSDPTRLLRAPGYYHHKAEPFLVETVWCSEVTYTYHDLISAFEAVKPRERRDPTGGVGLAEYDGRVMVPLLNGHWLQNGESFYLKEQPNGNANIYRLDDDYSTGVFIDPDGLFGNCLFGPTLVDWLRWYGWTKEEVEEGLGELLAGHKPPGDEAV
jgi:hypothetical protein